MGDQHLSETMAVWPLGAFHRIRILHVYIHFFSEAFHSARAHPVRPARRGTSTQPFHGSVLSASGPRNSDGWPRLFAQACSAVLILWKRSCRGPLGHTFSVVFSASFHSDSLDFSLFADVHLVAERVRSTRCSPSGIVYTLL